MNKNIGEMTESELKDFIIELQEENQELKEINEEHKKLNGELREENKKYKETIDTIKSILNNQMNYRELVDIVNAIEEVIKEAE